MDDKLFKKVTDILSNKTKFSYGDVVYIDFGDFSKEGKIISYLKNGFYAVECGKKIYTVSENRLFNLFEKTAEEVVNLDDIMVPEVKEDFKKIFESVKELHDALSIRRRLISDINEKVREAIEVTDLEETYKKLKDEIVSILGVEEALKEKHQSILYYVDNFWTLLQRITPSRRVKTIFKEEARDRVEKILRDHLPDMVNLTKWVERITNALTAKVNEVSKAHFKFLTEKEKIIHEILEFREKGLEWIPSEYELKDMKISELLELLKTVRHECKIIHERELAKKEIEEAREERIKKELVSRIDTKFKTWEAFLSESLKARIPKTTTELMALSIDELEKILEDIDSEIRGIVEKKEEEVEEVRATPAKLELKGQEVEITEEDIEKIESLLAEVEGLNKEVESLDLAYVDDIDEIAESFRGWELDVAEEISSLNSDIEDFVDDYLLSPQEVLPEEKRLPEYEEIE